MISILHNTVENIVVRYIWWQRWDLRPFDLLLGEILGDELRLHDELHHGVRHLVHHLVHHHHPGLKPHLRVVSALETLRD